MIVWKRDHSNVVSLPNNFYVRGASSGVGGHFGSNSKMVNRFENEGTRFWLGVLNDLKARGVEDILIASIDKA
ncbi:MAG: hypothetical protein HYX60_01715 [Legionella longbeachae]|nr:hypothetical protein [Legionella longbeachae]